MEQLRYEREEKEKTDIHAYGARRYSEIVMQYDKEVREEALAKFNKKLEKIDY